MNTIGVYRGDVSLAVIAPRSDRAGPPGIIDLVGSANSVCSVGDTPIACLHVHVLEYVQDPGNFARGDNSSYAHLEKKRGHIAQKLSAVGSDRI